MSEKIPIPYAQVQKLASLQCTYADIAAVCGVSLGLIKNKWAKDEGFQEAIEAGQGEGRASLRRLQFKSAAKGNSAILIWLGKQYLGQREQYADLEAPQVIAAEIRLALRAINEVTAADEDTA